MARACSVCTHPEHHAIDRAVVDGGSNRSIAKQFGVGADAVLRHKRDHLGPLLAGSSAKAAVLAPAPAAEANRSSAATQTYAQQRASTEREHAIDIMAELSRQIARVNQLSDAVDRWLRDPEDPTRYDINPRADEITVIYLDYADRNQNGEPRRKKARLSVLLAQLERESGGMIWPVSGESKHADPRDLLIKAADGLKGQLQLLASVLEKLHSAQEVESFQLTVLEAIGEVAPDVRAAIHDTLRRRLPLRRAL